MLDGSNGEPTGGQLSERGCRADDAGQTCRELAEAEHRPRRMFHNEIGFSAMPFATVRDR
jgi:hypothetical protein